MQGIESQEELVDVIRKIKLDSLFKGFETGDKVKVANISFGSKSVSDIKYAWSSAHTTINYQGELIDVKAPKIIGFIGVTIGRYLLEYLFNGHGISFELPTNSLNREANIYKKLSENGFPTLESRQDLLYDGNTKLLDGVLLTRKIIEPRHTIDCIKDDPDNALDYVAAVSSLLYELHYIQNQVWVDAWLGNTMYDGDKMLLFDFGFKENEKIDMSILRVRDLTNFTLSAVYRTGKSPSKVIKIIFDNYEISNEDKTNLKREIYPELLLPGNPLTNFIKEKLFLQPVTGLSYAQVKEIKKELYNSV